MTIVAQAPSQSKSDRVEEMIGQLRCFVREAAAQGRGAHEVERELFRRLLQLGLLLLQEFFARLGPGDEGAQVAVAGRGWLKRSAALQARRYQSIFGELVLKRWVYSRGAKQRVEYVPVDARAKLPAGKWSYVLQDWAQQLAVEGSFGYVRQVLQRLLGLEVAVASLEQMNRALSEAVAGFWEAQPAAPVAQPAALVVLSADGKGVPMRRPPASVAPAPALAPTPRGPTPGRKQMALVGAVYTVAPFVRTPREVLEALFAPGPAPPAAGRARRPVPAHKRVRAVLSEAPPGQPGHSAQVIFPWLLREARARDPRRQPRWVVLMDGQPALWEALAAHLGAQPRVEILDLLHAAGYLWQAVHLFHHSGSAKAQQLMKLCLLALLEGKAQTLMLYLAEQARSAGLSAADQAQLASISAYFHRHRDRLHYDQYLARGYPIASGVIEGACRHVINDRLERTGMNWTRPGAQAMLALRCVAINEQWEDFIAHRIKHETARLYPYAANSTPEPEPFLRAA
jgi:hypothetical protein